MKVREGKMSLLAKARARPDQVKQVIRSVQQQGLAATYQKITNKLDSLTPLGYSLSGIVEDVASDVAEFAVGDRVACAGAGYANHAEVNFIPKNLVVAVPESVSMEHAAFTTVGAIALHAVRQANPRLGETACVIGLGLLGQILVQLLRANGVKVIGLDLSGDRSKLAMSLGCTVAGLPDDPKIHAELLRLTKGVGADFVIIAAGGASNAALDTAMRCARDRARIVSLGKTGLDVPWKEFFERELELVFSRSYGPGRYDPTYEEKGIDYPIGYVRWTERRNMEAFLDLVARGQVQLDPITSAVRPFGEAEAVYDLLAHQSSQVLGILFRYESQTVPQPRLSNIGAPQSPRPRAPRNRDPIRLCVLGAGNYASSMLLPHLAKRRDVVLSEVVTNTALSGANAVRKFGFTHSSTSTEATLERGQFDALLIATRHASHARLVAATLRTGCPVFVEKPLAIDKAGLEMVLSAMKESANDRLQVGFNRRFSPMVAAMRQHFATPRPPIVMNYRVHAGPTDVRSWYNDRAEGSRFIGEAGHFLDVMSFVAGALPRSVVARRINSVTADDRENLTVVVTFADGSVGTLMYLTQGAMRVPKETFEVFGGGRTAQLDNFRVVRLMDGTVERSVREGASDKGQKSELEAFLMAVRGGGPMPIPIESLIATTRLTLAAEESAERGSAIVLDQQ